MGAASLIQKNAIGTIIGAVLKLAKYKRAAIIPSSARGFQQPEYQLYSTTIPISTLTQEAYEFDADVTEHAVEAGAYFGDHVILRPIQLSVEGQISNWNGTDRAKDCLESMIKVWKSRQRFSLLTTHTKLDDMVCIQFRPTNSMPEWGKLEFSAVFRQVKLITLETAQYPASKVNGDSAVDSNIKSTGADVSKSAQGPATPSNGARK